MHVMTSENSDGADGSNQSLQHPQTEKLRKRLKADS